MQLRDMVHEGTSLAEIGTYLDSLTHGRRLEEMYTINPKAQAKLYDMADGQAGKLIPDYIPQGKAPMTEVIHWGHNSLPMHTKFQKRFALAPQTQGPQVCVGYNEQTLRFFSGPGYFTAKEAELDGKLRVVIDYYDVPTIKCPAWPPIEPNSARLGRFIYFEMRDWMWKVSKHLSIGRAKRRDQWLDNWFLLCRED